MRADDESAVALDAAAASGPSCRFGAFAKVGANSGDCRPSWPVARLLICALPALWIVLTVVAACAAATARPQTMAAATIRGHWDLNCMLLTPSVEHTSCGWMT